MQYNNYLYPTARCSRPVEYYESAKWSTHFIWAGRWGRAAMLPLSLFVFGRQFWRCWNEKERLCGWMHTACLWIIGGRTVLFNRWHRADIHLLSWLVQKKRVEIVLLLENALPLGVIYIEYSGRGGPLSRGPGFFVVDIHFTWNATRVVQKAFPRVMTFRHYSKRHIDVNCPFWGPFVNSWFCSV